MAKVMMLSVIGKDSQTPAIPAKWDIQNATGRMKSSPRAREIIWAGSTWPVAAKYIARIILKPANGMAVKYSFMPGMAICCKR